MPSSATSRNVREGAVGGHRDAHTQSAPSTSQTTFSFDAKARLNRTQTEMREAINGAESRKVQLEWLAPLLDDPDAAEMIVGWVNARCGYEPPVRSREVSQEQIDKAAREVLAELKDDEQRELMRARIAKRLGVRPDKVRF
jgi:hypothetical protein